MIIILYVFICDIFSRTLDVQIIQLSYKVEPTSVGLLVKSSTLLVLKLLILLYIYQLY